MTASATMLGVGAVLAAALACAGQVVATPEELQEANAAMPNAREPAYEPGQPGGSADATVSAAEEGGAATPPGSDPGAAAADDGGAEASSGGAPGVAAAAAPAVQPAPLEGRIETEHPAALRARWATNPVAWSSERPEVFALAFDREGSRERSLAVRTERRPYAGAPPVMGHSIDFGGTLDCMECHDIGRRIGKRVARPMSHQPMSQCTQCHTPGAAPDPFVDLSPPWPVASTFLGMESAGTGSRLGPGAPPTIPHTLQLRVRCLSCHGEFGYEGLRTDHPFRAQCTQCHVPTAALDPLGPMFGR
jgi:cytochrome c-type protein NapB